MVNNRLTTFNIGGIHPDENKLSKGKPIENLPLPKEVKILTGQHTGASAVPIVAIGDFVKTGQLIAKKNGFISANVHSSVSGKVVKIDDVINASGYKSKAIIISVTQDDWDENIDLSDSIVKNFDIEQKDIIEKVAEAGIVGLGGAAFPSHVKLSVPQGKTAKYLIVNGAECEPFITSDHRLMLEKPEEILIGTKILMKAINVEKALIGIENNKIDAIQKLKKFSVGCEGIEIKALKVKYPQGAEKQLVHALTKKQIPSGGLPIDCGCVVHNVGTVFSVYEAVTKNKPVIERVVTVSGNSLKNPSNFRVRIGTSVLELINAAGGMPEDTEKILMGGPMMGKALKCVDIPVTKGTSAIVLISSKDARRKGYLNCIRCGKCVSICPLGLEPYLLMQLAEKQMHEKLEYEKVMNCCECGSCSYICPSNRPLLDYIRLGKFVIGNIIKSRIKINAK